MGGDLRGITNHIKAFYLFKDEKDLHTEGP